MTDPHLEILLSIAPPKNDIHILLQKIIFKSAVEEPRKTSPISIAIAKSIRQLTDKLTTEELTLLIQETHPEELEKLGIPPIPKEKIKEIAKKLLQKGAITKDKFKELTAH